MLYFNTVNDGLKNALNKLMTTSIFNDFRLVGGTALSLQIGHRKSIDLDLFTDVSYGSIDFKLIEQFLESNFHYTDDFSNLLPAMGKSYVIGESKEKAIKLDVFYVDPFVWKPITKNGIRLAKIKEIAAMKLNVVQYKGRKKDFWDLHELMNYFSLNEMLDFHKRRYPYTHERSLLISNLTSFEKADYDFAPICYKNKYWEFIKADFEDAVKAL